METETKKGKKHALLIVLLVLLLLGLAAALFFLRPDGDEESKYEANVTVGGIPNFTEAQRLDFLNRQAALGEAPVFMNSSPCTLSNGEVNWLIENPDVVAAYEAAQQVPDPENGTGGAAAGTEPVNKLIRVTTCLQDTGEVIYHTGFIKPGYHIESAPLEKELPEGSYTLSTTIYLYDLDTEEYINEINVVNYTLKVFG